MIRHGFMTKKRMTAVIALICAFSFVAGGCANITVNTQNPVEEKTEDSQEAATSDTDISGKLETWTRKSLLPLTNDESEFDDLHPAVPVIEIADDMSNIINFDEYEFHDNKAIDRPLGYFL